VQVTQGGGGQSLYELVPDIAGWSEISTIRHGFTEFVVEGRTIHGTTYSVENDAIELLPNGELQAIDRFEIHARGDAERASFAAARAKSKAEQEFDLDAMIRHTLERNRLHDVHEGGGLHS
jgi:acid phosphatase type 7